MVTVAPDELEHLAMMATRAPSVHNTQPWTLCVTPDGLRLGTDRSRQLEVIDPQGRQLMISCGALIHHLEVAARAMGLDTTVDLEDLRSSEVATISFSHGAEASKADVAHAVAILHRHTHRDRFEEPAVTRGELARLDRAVQAQGVALRIVRPDETAAIAVLLSHAERALHQVDGYEQELARWVWKDRATIEGERSDGMPREAVAHGLDRAETFAGREFDGPATRPVEPPPAERPTVVVLCTANDAAVDWTTAGRALSALLLTATEMGLVAQPLAQVIDLPFSRHALATTLGIVGAPQMMLRLGHGSSRGRAPRRPVADVLGGV